MINIDNPAQRWMVNGELALGVGVRSSRGVEIAMAAAERRSSMLREFEF